MKKRSFEPKPPSHERVKIVMDPTGRPPLTASTIERMKVWLEVESREVREVVRSIGGAVLGSSFMDSTLTAHVPYEDSDAHIETIRSVPNVKYAYKTPLIRYEEDGWY